MQPKRLTQSYWNRYQVEPPKPRDKYQKDKPKENFMIILKQQAKSDPVTKTLSILACFLLTTLIIAQIVITLGG